MKAKCLIALTVLLLSAFFISRADLSLPFLSVSVEVESPEPGDVYQVFYDTGRGFNEAESVLVRVATKRHGFVRLDFSLPPKEIRSLRVDPGIREGPVIIRSVAAQTVLFSHRWKANDLVRDFKPLNQIGSFSVENGLLALESTGNDPYFANPDLRSAVRSIERKFKVSLFIFIFCAVLFNLFAGRVVRSIRAILGFEETDTKSTPASGQRTGTKAFQSPWLQHAAILLLCIAMVVLLLGANPFRGETVAPVDLLFLYDGWQSLGYTVPGLLERSDILDALLPNWMYLKDKLHKGEFPLWNLISSGGTPGIQNFTLGALTPSFAAFALPWDDALGFYLSSLVKLVIAGFGTYLLLNAFLSRTASFFGAVIYTACGFHAAWLYWTHVSTSAWVPWLLWSLVMYFKKNDNRWLAGITVSSLMMILGGFPSVAAYGFYSFALLLLILNTLLFVSTRGLIARTVLPLLAVIVAFAIAAVPVFTLKELLSLVDLGYRTGGTVLNGKEDLSLFLRPYSHPHLHTGLPMVEKTVYVGVIPVVLVLLWAFCINGRAVRFVFSKDRLFGAFVLFSLLLLISSTLLAFGLIDHSLIMMIPIFKFNVWNRLASLIGLSMALLSAFWMDVLIKSAARRNTIVRGTVLIFMFCIIGYQFHDQEALFSKFNRPVQSHLFFPQTGSTKFVTENLKPLQTVIADDSYMISGTLGSYGIPEWFAHNFKTEKEKSLLGEIVKKPFASATAAMFSGDRIDIASPLLNAFGVRYLLVNTTLEDIVQKKLVFEQPTRTRFPVPPLPIHRVIQHFESERTLPISGISIPFSTYGQPQAPSAVRVILRHEPGHGLIGESRVNPDSITEGRWVNFDFGRTITLEPGSYSFEIAMEASGGGERLTVWATDGPVNGKSVVEIDGNRTDKSILYRFYDGERDGAEKWKRRRLEPAITIFENSECPQGAYFINTLDTPPEKIGGDLVVTKIVTNSEIIVENRRPDAGWIVLPVRAYPGWKAFKGQTELRVEKYLGVFPAVWLAQPGIVSYKYRPDSLLYGGLVSLCGVLSFCSLILVVVWRKRRVATSRKSEDKPDPVDTSS